MGDTNVFLHEDEDGIIYPIINNLRHILYDLEFKTDLVHYRGCRGYSARRVGAPEPQRRERLAFW